MRRRDIIQALGVTAAVAASPAAASDSKPTIGFRLGVCTYSVREFQRKLAISMIQKLGVAYVSVKEFHLPYTSTAAEIAKTRSEFEKAGLTIASGGNIDLRDEDPTVLRHYFQYA